MNKALASQRIYDLLFIANNNVSWFRLAKKRGSVEILKSEKILADLYSQGIFHLNNLEPAVSELITKFNLKEIGIIIHLPTLLFQRISLSRDSMPREAILNYLKTSFPLPLDKYSLFYREDKYQKFGSLSNFNIFFVSKEIIEGLLSIIEKYGIIPLFITPSVEAFYQYLVSKAIVDFNEEYLVFLIDNFSLTALLIKNLRIEKVIIDEIDLDNFDTNLIFRIYNFLKANFSTEGKVLFFSDKSFSKIENIVQQQIFFPTKSLNVLLEGGYNAFERVINDEDLIDFLPIKPYFAYFLNRLPQALIFVSIYTFALSLIFFGGFIFFSQKFDREILSLQHQTSQQLIPTIDEEVSKFQKIVDISNKLNTTTLANFTNLRKVINIDNLTEVNFSKNSGLDLIFNAGRDESDRIKKEIKQILPEAKVIIEEYMDNRLKLRYNF